MRKALTKADNDFQMFADYYKIYQDFYVPEDNDEYWTALVMASEEFGKKYNSQYARALILAYLESREELFKLKKA